MVQGTNPDRIKALIDASIPEGAEAIGMQFCQLKAEYRNEKTYRELLPYANERFRVLDYTDQMPRYMSAADVYITKPGGLSTSEAIAKRVPMIFINAVPGVETRNFDFLVEQGVATGARNWIQVVSHVQKALRDPSTLDGQIESMRQFTTKNAAEQICRYVVDYVNNR